MEFGGDFLEGVFVEGRAGVRGEGTKCDGPPTGKGPCGSPAALSLPEGFFVFFGRWDKELGLE